MRMKALFLSVAVLCTATVQAGDPDCKPACEKERPFLSLFKKKDCGKEKCEKECVRVDDKKKITHTHYSCIEKDVCVSNCTKCNLGKKKCGSCDDGKCDKCGKVRTVRQLVKRFEVEEVCTTKCVPVHKEVCPTVIVPAPACVTPLPLAVEQVPVKPTIGPEKVPVKPMVVEPMKPTVGPEKVPVKPMVVEPMKK